MTEKQTAPTQPDAPVSPKDADIDRQNENRQGDMPLEAPEPDSKSMTAPDLTPPAKEPAKPKPKAPAKPKADPRAGMPPVGKPPVAPPAVPAPEHDASTPPKNPDPDVFSSNVSVKPPPVAGQVPATTQSTAPAPATADGTSAPATGREVQYHDPTIWALAKRLQQGNPCQLDDGIVKTTLTTYLALQTGENLMKLGVKPVVVLKGMQAVMGKVGWRSPYLLEILQMLCAENPLSFAKEKCLFQYAAVVQSDDNEDADTIYQVQAVTTHGIPVRGAPVSANKCFRAGFAKGKNGQLKPFWAEMPALMASYRAVTFFMRIHAPLIISGGYTSDELKDIHL